MERHIVLVGAAHIDRIARSASAFRLHASNPGSLRESAGGAALNAAFALRRLGVGVRLVSARGGDAAAAQIGDAVDRAGIQDDAITWLDRSTASYTAILDGSGELIAGVADMDLYDLLTPRVLSRRHIRSALDKADAVLFDANLPAETVQALASLDGDQPIAAIAVSPAKAMRLRPVLSHLAVLFASRAEAVALIEGPPDISRGELASRLTALGLNRAVITDGPREAILVDRGRVALQAPPSVDTIRDVTGAGDTLAAVTLAETLDGWPFFESARVGMVAASLHISSGLPVGARPTCRSIAAGLPPAKPHPV